MAVTDAYRIPESGEATLDRLGNKVYRELWQVETSTVADAQITVLASGLVPQLGDTFAVGSDSDAQAIVTSVHPRRIAEQPRFWRLAVEYTYKPTSGSWTGEAGSLTLELPEVDGFAMPFTEPAAKTIDGKPIINSVGDPFDPPAEKDANRHGVRWTDYVTTCPLAVARTYLAKGGAINSDVLWQGKDWSVPVHHAKVGGFSYRRVAVQNVILWQRSIELHLADEPWYCRPLDAGLYKSCRPDGTAPQYDDDPQATSKIKATDALGNPVDAPILLDGHGQSLAKGADGFYHEFHVYYELPFMAALGVPEMNPTIT